MKRLTTSELTVDGVEFQLPDGQQAMALWRQGAGSSQVQTKGVSAVQLLQSGVASPASDSLLLQLTEAPVWITGQTLGLQ